MIDEAALRARAAEVCRCGHARAFHDACSKCLCAFFLPKGETNASLIKAWLAERRVRKSREA